LPRGEVDIEGEGEVNVWKGARGGREEGETKRGIKGD